MVSAAAEMITCAYCAIEFAEDRASRPAEAARSPAAARRSAARMWLREPSHSGVGAEATEVDGSHESTTSSGTNCALHAGESCRAARRFLSRTAVLR
jgi:hypothetical protein